MAERPWCVVNEDGLIVSRRETEVEAKACRERIREDMRKAGNQIRVEVSYRPAQRQSAGGGSNAKR